MCMEPTTLSKSEGASQSSEAFSIGRSRSQDIKITKPLPLGGVGVPSEATVGWITVALPTMWAADIAPISEK